MSLSASRRWLSLTMIISTVVCAVFGSTLKFRPKDDRTYGQKSDKEIEPLLPLSSGQQKTFSVLSDPMPSKKIEDGNLNRDAANRIATTNPGKLLPGDETGYDSKHEDFQGRETKRRKTGLRAKNQFDRHGLKIEFGKFNEHKADAHIPNFKSRTRNNQGHTFSPISSRHATNSEKYSSLEEILICHPCICDRDFLGMVHAECSDRNLWSIPDTLPRGVRAINMSYNSVRHFHISSVSIYPNLVQLDLRRNRIRRVVGNPKQPSTRLDSKLVDLNLYYNNIVLIDDGALCAFPNLSSLQLSMNRLVNISKGTFKCLKHLSHLDISKNHLRHIEDASFDDLCNLKDLYLNNNLVLGYAPKHLRARIFEKLNLIRTFHIHGCSNGYQYYPNQVFDHMPLLEELSFDGLDSTLFSRKMIHLHTLNIGPHAICTFKTVPAKMFLNTPNLQHLSIRYCNFHSIESEALKNTTKLETLFLQHITTYDLNKAFDELEMLQNSSLKSLTLIHLFHKTGCRVLSKVHGKYMKKLQLLEELNLTDNRLSLLDNDFLRAIPRTLKRLVLSANRFDLDGNIWNRIPFLTNLKELDISIQNLDSGTKYPKHSSSFELSSSSSNLNIVMDYNHWNLTAMEMNEDTRGNDNDVLDDTPTEKVTDDVIIIDNEKYGDDVAISNIGRKSYLLPPNLNIVKASMYIGFGEVILQQAHLGPNKLKELIFTNTFMSSWGTGQLPETVTHVDFSYNPCNVLLYNFFPVNNSLLVLNIRNNYLGVHFSEDVQGMIFSRLGKLGHLNIASNTIFDLPADFIKGLSSLITLDLSNNKIRVFNMTLSHIRSIRFINVSKNAINYVTQKSRDHMDEIATKYYLEVDFTNNLIPCSCDGIPLLKWLANTNVVLSKKYSLTCVESKGKIEPIGDFELRLKVLRSECRSKDVLIEIASASIVLVVLALVAGLVYRHRWKLRYMKNQFFSKWLGFQPKQRKSWSFKFDAYVLYDQKDEDLVLHDAIHELERKRGHKLCVEDRDFIPGTFTSNNITCAIQNSNVTLFVISPSSVNSPEFEYVLQMAIMEEYYSETKREVLYLLLDKETVKESLCAHLLSILRKDRFQDIPPFDDVTDERWEIFWDKLSEVIGHTNNTETPCLDPI